jgi:hypothetical protein
VVLTTERVLMGTVILCKQATTQWSQAQT